MKNRTKGQSVRPNLKPHGPRWPVQCPLRPGPPRTSERVYTPRVYYNHLLQEKQTLFFELAAKKKPLLPPSPSKTHIQTVSLPQPQNPTAGWLRETERKMTGDKLRGGKKVHIFSEPNERLGNVDLSVCVSQTKIKCLTCKAPLMKKAKFIERQMKFGVACVANLRSRLFFYGTFHQVHLRL